ncbi:aminotransferase class IV family protein [Saccharomonospora xinjiangensis]|uniref:aminotransferase class IV family protein n=1 Tax=Saccharomonospora xinjiangensis TaxID=75294 RepID=UPI00350F9CF3
MTFFAVHRNGRPATADDLAPLAFAGHAHFTAMQVRDGRVRGLDLHLRRLRDASLTLFGQALPDEQVRSYLRAALESGPADVSLTATVSSPVGEFTAEAAPGLDVLVRTGPAASPPEGPLTLMPVEHERFLPEVKHVGEVAKTHLLRGAKERGFDDAVFTDRKGRLSEATIWNLAFLDGDTVVWPSADVLAGVTMGVVRRHLDGLGVNQRVQEVTLADVAGFAGAVVLNSWTPGVPVSRIDTVELPSSPTLAGMLHDAYAAESPTAL